MNGPEHYLKAEQLLAQAESQFLDDSSDPAPRGEYATEYEWIAALEESQEAHELSLRTAALFASMATGHAKLAQVAAYAMSQPISGMPDEPGLDQEEFEDWYAAVNGLSPQTPLPVPAPEPYIPVALSIRLRELHVNDGGGDCGTCADETGAARWPCDTFTALDAAERELSPDADGGDPR